MKKVLVTGFEPFGGESVNPSWETARALNDAYIRLRLPVEYDRAGDMLLEALARVKPDIVVCLGQAGGRRGISVECAALNRDHAEAADNAGVIRKNSPISGGESAYFTSADTDGVISAINAVGVEARASYFAGTYVCNHIYYLLLEHIAKKRNAEGIFLHVPYSDGQSADAPHMPISDMVKGVSAAIEFLLNT